MSAPARDPAGAAQAFLRGDEGAELPSVDALRGLAARRPAEAVAGAAELARAAWLAGDDPAVADFLAIGTPLVDSADEPGAIAFRIAALWARAGAGEASVEEEARDLHKRAVAAALPLRAVEAVAVIAWDALARDEVDAGVQAARRASRMARTEALPEAEWLANLVLARARRHAGRPHLATRILLAVSRLASPPWRGALAWELALAGGAGATAALLGEQPARDTPAFRDVIGRAARALIALLAAAREGDRARLETARDEALSLVRHRPALAAEAAWVAAALDPERPVPPALADWSEGRVPGLPRGLHGAAPVPPGAPTAVVLVSPARTARRVLAGAAGLLASRGAPAGTLVGSAREHHRTDAALATLALAGAQGLVKADLFRAVYGIPYVQTLHEGVHRVLLHRMRKRLGDAGEVRRDEDRVVLAVQQPLALPDPRCARATEDAVLELLAARGGRGSEEIAAELRISVRAAQAALRQLVEEGACVPARQGRELRYQVDDTTFSEPTPYTARRPGAETDEA